MRSPSSSSRLTRTAIGQLVKRCLQEGAAIEIEGLGIFRPRPDGGVSFVAYAGPKVFIAYAVEDAALALRLYEELAAAGCQPWMDRKRLLPGQNWPRAIEQAIAVADFFVPCFSHRSVYKRGQFQAELRYALDCAAKMPHDDVFVLPVRLEECAVPAVVASRIQYVDLFPDWRDGVLRLRQAIGQAMNNRKSRR